MKNRFVELKKKAIEKLNGFGDINQRLTNAVIELSYLHADEVDTDTWNELQMIIDSCKTHNTNKEQGVYYQSICNMNTEKKEHLKNAILNI